MNSKPIAVGLVFGVGLALALNSWLLVIMFGIIFCNFQYETPLAHIKDNKMKKNAFPILFAIMVLMYQLVSKPLCFSS